MTRTEEIDCGSFFDQFEDLIDFPTDPINGSLNFNDFSTENEIGPIFSGDPTNAAAVSYLSVPVPYEEMLQLEWLSNFFENSSVVEEDNMIRTESPPPHNQNHFSCLSSPISVLESSSTGSSSCSGGGAGGGGKTKTKTKRGPRSKRPRPVTFTPRSDNFAESRILLISGEEQPKKKKINKSSFSSSNQLIAIRKCMHCEITKTPQWRMGPMGPKTLCNACGVRHKSGRLFPEYRPAASPTFVPALHSNSHKKVMEMRAA